METSGSRLTWGLSVHSVLIGDTHNFFTLYLRVNYGRRNKYGNYYYDNIGRLNERATYMGRCVNKDGVRIGNKICCTLAIRNYSAQPSPVAKFHSLQLTMQTFASIGLVSFISPLLSASNGRLSIS